MSNSPTLGLLKNETLAENTDFPDIQLRAMLTMLIIDLADYFSVGKNMSDMQVAQTVDLFIGMIGQPGDYDWMRMEDIKLCFDYIKRGRYGKLFDRLDGAIIFEMIDKYAQERQDLKSAAQVKNHQDVKLLESGKINTGWTGERLNILKQLAKSLEAPRKQIAVKKTDTAMGAQQKKDNEWLRLFDSLHKKHNIIQYANKNVSGKYIKWRGKILSANEFLVFKNNQYQTVMQYLIKRNK